MNRVLLVYDRAGWAWQRMADGIARFHPQNYRVHTMDSARLRRIMSIKAGLDYDAALQMSWTEGVTQAWWPRNCTLVASHGIEFPEEARHGEFMPGWIATRLRNKQEAASRLNRYDSVLCVSKALTSVAAALVTYKAVYTPPGVDETLFVPQRVPSYKLRIGWCGQFKGITKGYSEVLEPLMARLGDHVEFIVNGRCADDPLPQSEMVAWFNSIDVLLTTSCSEGCQMPVLEAMSTGAPVIGTESGAMTEIITNWENGVVVSGYSLEPECASAVDRLADVIATLVADRSKVDTMGLAARQTIVETRSWRDLSKVWLDAIMGV